MSESPSTHGHDTHGTSARATGKKISSVVWLAGLPLVVIAGLISAYKVQDSGRTSADMSEQAVMARIQKVGQVVLGESIRTPKTGEDVYKVQCVTCHGAGLLGAPKFGDAAAWAPRIGAGYDKLLTAALKGKGSMTPQAGAAFSDAEIGLAVVLMANAGGAKFTQPAAPETATAPAAAASAKP